MTGHVIYNLAYTYKFQLKTAQISWFDDLSCVSKSGVCHKTNKSLAKSFAVIMNDNHLHSAVCWNDETIFFSLLKEA